MLDRIINADCMDAEVGLPSLATASISLCVTDPPYGLTDTNGAAHGIVNALAKLSLPQLSKDVALADGSSTTGLIPFFEPLALSGPSTTRGDARVNVAGVAVHFDDSVEFRQEEVASIPPPKLSVVQRKLPDVCDAEPGKCLGYFVLELGVSSDAQATRHAEDHITTELFQGGFGVSVRLSDHALAQSQAATSVVALAGTELSTMLRLDSARRTGELSPTSATRHYNSSSSGCGPRLVRARTAAGGLPSPLEALRIGLINPTTNRADALHCHLLVPPGFWELLSPIVAQSGFMGKAWDSGIPSTEIWREVLRVLKPGASCFVFTGARQDAVMGNIRSLADAGFDVQHSSLTWCFANGNMPKSLSLSRDADKAAFVAWVKSVPEGETETRAALMGWSNVDVRKAASAAVNGQFWRPIDGANRSNSGMWGDVGDAFGSIANDRSQGAALLASIVERFGDAPGVRMATGNKHPRYPRGPGGNTWTVGGAPDGTRDKPEMNTAPSTPEAQQLDGWHGGAVPCKPMFETVLWATKPRDKGPIRDNVLRHGTGGVNIEAARVPYEDEDAPPARATHDGDVRSSSVYAMASTPEHERVGYTPPDAGRYPSNLLVTARALGDKSKYGCIESWAAQHGLDDEWLEAALEGIVWMPKPSQGEKNAGCEGLPEKKKRTLDGGPMVSPIAGDKRVPGVGNMRNNHTTVKPVTLIAYLIALACPEDGVVLDPFLGSGTTAVAATELGRPWVGFELEEEYCTIAEARVSAAQGRKRQETATMDFAEVAVAGT